MEYSILSNGLKMPKLGYGVYQVSKEECENCVLTALKTGYRHIDTAQSYFNEEEVGSAIKNSGVPRNEIFLTTKIWIEHYGYKQTKKSVEDSLHKLKTDYIDLVLLHQPFSDVYGAWKALEEMYLSGVIKAIGVSNFYPDRLVDICSFANIKPMVNQIETHPHNQQTEARKWLNKYNVVHEAWAPFGEGRNGLFTNPTLEQIGKKHQKTTAQVMLRWAIQRDVVVIPKSVHKERIAENFDIFDFTLDNQDMQEIASLDKNQSSFFSHTDPNMVEWFSQMVENRKHNNDHTKETKNW